MASEFPAMRSLMCSVSARPQQQFCVEQLLSVTFWCVGFWCHRRRIPATLPQVDAGVSWYRRRRHWLRDEWVRASFLNERDKTHLDSTCICMIIWGTVLCSVCFPSINWTVLEQITCSASQCRGVRPHRGDAAYARHKSHRNSRGCYQSLRFVAWSCLFRTLPWWHTLCFQLCTTSTFTFGQFSEVGLLAIFTDVTLRRQTLQASVPVLETVRTNGHRAGLSHSCPFTFRPSTCCPVRALSCVPGPEVLVCLLHHCCCCCERARFGCFHLRHDQG